MAEWLGLLSPGSAGNLLVKALIDELAADGKALSQAEYLAFDQATGPGSALATAAHSLVNNAPWVSETGRRSSAGVRP